MKKWIDSDKPPILFRVVRCFIWCLFGSGFLTALLIIPLFQIIPLLLAIPLFIIWPELNDSFQGAFVMIVFDQPHVYFVFFIYFFVTPFLPSSCFVLLSHHQKLNAATVETTKSFGFFGGQRIKYNCPSCDERLRSPINEAGTTDTCPNCYVQFTVPTVQKPSSRTAKK